MPPTRGHRIDSRRGLTIIVKKPLAAGGTVRSGRYAERVKLVVGDVVVYPAHGAGRVAAREQRVVLGAVQEVVVLELADGLSVTLPMQLARELLRPLVSEAGLSRVQETLREDGALSLDPPFRAGGASVWSGQAASRLACGLPGKAGRPPPSRCAPRWERGTRATSPRSTLPARPGGPAERPADTQNGGSRLRRRSYTAAEVDAIAAYCPDVDGCFFVPAERFDGHLQVGLRLAPSRNNQRAGITWAEDFVFKARLEALLGP